MKMNAAYQAQVLRESSTVIAKAIKNDGVRVTSGSYDLGTGRVTLADSSKERAARAEYHSF